MRSQIRRTRVLFWNSQIKVFFFFTLLAVFIVVLVYCLIVQKTNSCAPTEDLLAYLNDDGSHGPSVASIPRNCSPCSIPAEGHSSNTLKKKNLEGVKPVVEKIKRILFWTSFFSRKDYGFGMGREPFVRANCRFTNCMTTDDRSLLDQSDAIIFHPNDYNASDVPIRRKPDQRYVFLYYEALAIQRDILPIFYQPLPNFFNWTMTYRRDSDVHSSHPYGIIRRKFTSRGVNVLPDALPVGTHLPDPAAQLHLTIRRRSRSTSANKTKLVAWFTSNCVTPGGREIFFRRMANYLPIDIYGACGNLKCHPDKNSECDMVLKTYKFYIAAENSICPDYVTEKLYRALGAGAVPIVYGGADYSAYAPPYSFIHAADFESPKALADYLILLDRNPGLYARYFEWTKDWEVVRNPADGWCSLCEKLNNPDQKPKSYKNIGEWWYDKFPCIAGTSLLNRYGLSNEQPR